jgi:hypothetical protein
VSCPHPGLHCPLLCRIHVVSGAFDLAGVAAVALVVAGLDPLARLEEMPSNFAGNYDICELTSRIGTLDPHQIPSEDANAHLVAQQGGLHCVLVVCDVGLDNVPLLWDSLLWGVQKSFQLTVSAQLLPT